MRHDDIRSLLKAQPFEPIQLALSDGRSVVIRHPDQALLTERKLFVMLAKVHRTRPLMTPATAEPVTEDWMLVDLLHVVGAAPANGATRPKRRRRRRDE